MKGGEKHTIDTIQKNLESLSLNHNLSSSLLFPYSTFIISIHFLLLNSSAWAKSIFPQYNFPHLAHTAQIPSQSAFSKWPLVKTKLHAMYYNALHIFNFFET